MTEPTTPSAKAVARELDRRHRRRRLVILGGWALLVLLAALYLRCGRGWGTGGNGNGHGNGQGAGSAAATVHRCAVRVTAKGYELEGRPAAREAIVGGCAQGVDVVVTGDARQGDWDALRGALEAAHIPTFTR